MDFQVISNVGDSNFGLHDIDQRILEYIMKEKDKNEHPHKREFFFCRCLSCLNLVRVIDNNQPWKRIHMPFHGCFSMNCWEGEREREKCRTNLYG